MEGDEHRSLGDRLEGDGSGVGVNVNTKVSDGGR